MSIRVFEAAKLEIGFNKAGGTLGRPKGLLVYERNGKRFFKVVSATGENQAEYYVGTGEIVLNTISGKVYFRPTAAEAAVNDEYAFVISPNNGALSYDAEELMKSSNKPEKFFFCGGRPSGWRNQRGDEPDYEISDLIKLAKKAGYKKVYVM